MIGRPKKTAAGPVIDLNGITPGSPKKKRPTRKIPNRLLMALGVGAALIIAGGGALQLRSPDKAPPNLNDVAAVKRLVSAHYVLPTDEEPALATITDPSKLTTKFLQSSKRGDKLLIYQQNSRVIIYRPSVDKIIDVGPVDITPLPSGQ